GSATVTITDNDVAPLPIVTIVATDANASETASDPGVFTVSRTGATTSSLQVNYTIGGSASNTSDYSTLSGSVTIGVGSSSATITVTPVDDSAVEGNETVILTLAANAAYTVGTPSSATVTIADNDSAATPSLAMTYDGQLRDKVGQAEFSLGADGKPDGTFTVTLNAGSGNRTVTRLFLTNTPGGVWDTQAPDSFWSLGAANGLDTALLNASNDSVNFAVSDGGSFKIFAADSSNAMFVNGVVFTLTANFSDGSTATAQTTISAVALPVVTIVATDSSAAETGSDPGVFTVSRTGATTSALQVNYTIGGTASNSTDYQTLPDSVIIPVGSSSATITVTPFDDSAVEGSETVVLTLSASAAYTVGNPSRATVTIADNDFSGGVASFTLSFDGTVADRVGSGEFARSADGKSDGVFTLTLNPGSGNRAVTYIHLRNMAGGAWDTNAPNGFWTLGVANDLQAALLNGPDDTVN